MEETPLPLTTVKTAAKSREANQATKIKIITEKLKYFFGQSLSVIPKFNQNPDVKKN